MCDIDCYSKIHSNMYVVCVVCFECTSFVCLFFVCVCVHACVCTSCMYVVFVYGHMCVCTCMCMYVCMYYVCLYVCINVRMCMHTCKCWLVYINAYRRQLEDVEKFAGKQEDKVLRSYSVSLLEQGLGKTEVLEETDETTKETADTYSIDDNELAVHVNINGDSTTGKVDFYA